MNQDAPLPEKETTWKDLFYGAGRKIKHIGQCLKRPAFVGKLIKATLVSTAIAATALLVVAGIVITKGRALPLDVIALGGALASGRVLKSVGRMWGDVGMESQKIWDRSFPENRPAPPMPRILPIGLSFKRTRPVAENFSPAAKPAPDNKPDTTGKAHPKPKMN